MFESLPQGLSNLEQTLRDTIMQHPPLLMRETELKPKRPRHLSWDLPAISSCQGNVGVIKNGT